MVTLSYIPPASRLLVQLLAGLFATTICPKGSPESGAGRASRALLVHTVLHVWQEGFSLSHMVGASSPPIPKCPFHLYQAQELGL